MTTSIEHLDNTDDLTADVLISAVTQAAENDVPATTPNIAGALFPGDIGSGDQEYKSVRSMLNDLADDGTLDKSREGNANAYSLPEQGGDGAPSLDDQREQARNEVLTDPDDLTDSVPEAAERDSDPLAEVADEAPDVEPDDDTDEGDTGSSTRDVAKTNSDIQSEFTLADHVPDERRAVAQSFIQTAEGDHERDNLCDPIPRRLDIDDPQTREFRIVRSDGRLKCPGSGLVITEDAVGDGLLPEDIDTSEPVYAQDPYCGSFRKVSVTNGRDGIRLKFRTHNLPKTTPRKRADEYLAFDDDEGEWTWEYANEDELAMDALARRAMAGAADPHKASLDDEGNLVDDGSRPDEGDDEDDGDSDGDN